LPQYIEQTSQRRFREDEFMIPAPLSRNKSSLRVRVVNTTKFRPLYPEPTDNDGFITALPNNGADITADPATQAPEAVYHVRLNAAGTWHVWVLASIYGDRDNEWWVGIDNQPPVAMYLWKSGRMWANGRQDGSGAAAFAIASPGIHTVRLWMKEDGGTFDKLLLASSSSYLPGGFGPAESPMVQDTFQESGGVVAMQAEHYSAVVARGSHSWQRTQRAISPDSSWSEMRYMAYSMVVPNAFGPVGAKNVPGSRSSAVPVIRRVRGAVTVTLPRGVAGDVSVFGLDGRLGRRMAVGSGATVRVGEENRAAGVRLARVRCEGREFVWRFEQ
jgi:hypothetical protein